MSATSMFGITVGRLCRIRASTEADALPLPLDVEGFLDSTAVEAYSDATIVPGALVPTTALAAVRAFVLLGEPGIGKSTEFARLTEAFPPGVYDHGRSSLMLVHGADLSEETFEELLGYRLRALPAATETGHDALESTPSNLAHLAVVIDQIDDSPIVRRLASRLRAALAGRDVSRLRLILGCRAADYPTDLTHALKESCGDCLVADLAPLTRRDAVQLADSVDGVDGETLIAAAVDKGAGALANVPLTLGLLVRTYRDAGSLDGNPVALFAQGVQWLANEPDLDRQMVRDDDFTVHQRLAVAERVAARLLLSGRRTIWCGRVLGSGEQDYRADLLALGDEVSAAGPFSVTSKLVEATLATALFTGRGVNRLGFAHGSFAGYLAARYLVRRQVPRAQLERLFLVAGADGTRSVPTQLRETAAWLVTLDPGHAQWLADADPESLVAHSAIVDNPTVRELIVEALLRQADEVELSDRPWARTRRQLDHPRLATQLGEVLARAGGDVPDDWPSMARVRLAVRLARESRTADLAGPLLELAANERWDSHTRLLAAMIAFEAAADRAVPGLRDILGTFTDVSFADVVDPDDELRGALLDMLWPDHITIGEVLPHLRRRRNRNLFGSYQGFQRTFVLRLSEDNVPAALAWARTNSGSSAMALVEPTSGDAADADADLPHERPVGDVDVELIEAIAERALSGPGALSRAPDVAAIVKPRLDRFDHPPLPTVLDVVDGSGEEPAATRELRRALARSLVELCATGATYDRADAWKIVDGWGSTATALIRPAPPPAPQPAGRRELLDTGDFTWAYRATSEALAADHPVLVDAFAQLAGYLFDLSDAESAELAYSDQDHPAWPCVRVWFEPMPIDCQLAQQWRQSHRRDIADTPDEALEAQRSEFVARLQQRLDAAAGGNSDAFWRLLWDLQIEPATGTGSYRFDDNVLNFPGIPALAGDCLERLTRASMLFITTANDYAGEWLGTTRYDKRGWAGYLALALLHRQGHLSAVPDTAWPSWTGALVWFDATASNSGDRAIKTNLLSAAVTYAPKQLADAAATYVRGELARGGLASEIKLIDPSWHADIADAWVHLLGEITDALGPSLGSEPAYHSASRDDTAGPNEPVAPLPDVVTLPTEETRKHAMQLWELMLGALVRAEHDRGIEIARTAIETSDGTRRCYRCTSGGLVTPQ